MSVSIRSRRPDRPAHPVLGDLDARHARPIGTDAARPEAGTAIYLCTDERTGSQWLCQRIAATGRLGRPTEYFNTPWMSGFLPGYPESPGEQFAIALELGTTPNGVFATKLHAWQFDRVRGAIDLFGRFDRRVFVHLYRRDVLGQAISLVRARQTNRYHHDDPEGEGRGESFDAEALDRTVADLCLNRARWLRFFAKNGLEPIEVAYEDLRRDPRRIVRAIARGAGVGLPWWPTRIRREHRIQSDERTRAWRTAFLEARRDFNDFPAPGAEAA